MRRRGCAGRGADHQISGLCHIDASFGQACDDTDLPRISGSPTTTENQSNVVNHLHTMSAPWPAPWQAPPSAAAYGGSVHRVPQNPCTATGVPLSVAAPLVPSPSSPTELSPQQNACWLALRAQLVAPNPADMPTKPLVVKPPTVTGVVLIDGEPTVPVPSSPTELSPQQSTWPVDRPAQTVLSLAPMDTTLLSPLTGTGTSLSVVVPLPSSPKRLAPQHCTPPALVSAQVAESATAICTTPLSPVTGTGVVLPLVEPLPSWPWLFEPQQSTVPFLSSAQVCSNPAAIWARLSGRPDTATGTLLLVVVPLPSSP